MRTALFPLSGMLIACATVANLLSVQYDQVSELMGLQAIANVFLIIVSYSAIRNVPGQGGSFSDLVRVRYKIVAFQVACLIIACLALDVSYLVLVGAVIILTSEIFSPCQYFVVNHRHAELTREQVVRALLLLVNAVTIYFYFKPVSAGYILFSNGVLTFLSYAFSLRREKLSLRRLPSNSLGSTTIHTRVWPVLRDNALVFLFRVIDMCTIWAVHLQAIKAASGDLLQYRLQTLAVSVLCQIFVLKRMKQTLDAKVLWVSALIITACSLASFTAIQLSGHLILLDFPKLGNENITLLLGLIAWMNTLGFMLAPHIHKFRFNPKSLP